MSKTKREVLDKMSELITKANEKTGLDDTNLSDCIDHLGGGSPGPVDPTDPVAYRASHRDVTWPYIPLPSEMKDSSSPYYQEGSCAYLLYDAKAGYCVPAFEINSANLVIETMKYMDTELVSTSTETLGTYNSVKRMQFDEAEADWDSYNYILLKLTGTFTSLNFNVEHMYNGYPLYAYSSNKLLEVSGKGVSGNFTMPGVNAVASMTNLVFFSFLETPGISDTVYMFSNCYSLVAIPEFDMSNATSMQYMFLNCYSLVAIPEFNMTNVTIMSRAFSSCYSLVTIPKLDTSKVTHMQSTFQNCYSLVAIPEFDTSSVIDMNGTFNSCYSLASIPKLDTSKANNMQSMFSNCYSLVAIPEFNMSNVKNTSSMFNSCYSLASIPKLDTSKANNMQSMFLNCRLIERVEFENYVVNSISYATTIFQNCFVAKEIIFRSMGSTIINSNTFSNCYHLLGTVDSQFNPEGLKDGYIYVPDDKVDILKADASWASVASQIKGLSELPA